MTPPSKAAPLAVTWWGHSSASVEMGEVRVITDPVLTRRVGHLHRNSPPPPAQASEADVVLISHLHADHLHTASLRKFDPQIPLVVPAGAVQHVRELRRHEVIELEPGDHVDISGVRIEAHLATHDGRRHPLARTGVRSLGFRVQVGEQSFWYPGDTGFHDGFAQVAPVDLGLVPIGGWGPTLGAGHLGPDEAARAIAQVGAEWSLAVHYGTFWPVAMRRIHPRSHRHLFEAPPARFRDAVQARNVPTSVLTPLFGQRIDLTRSPIEGTS